MRARSQEAARWCGRGALFGAVGDGPAGSAVCGGTLSQMLELYVSDQVSPTESPSPVFSAQIPELPPQQLGHFGRTVEQPILDLDANILISANGAPIAPWWREAAR